MKLASCLALIKMIVLTGKSLDEYVEGTLVWDAEVLTDLPFILCDPPWNKKINTYSYNYV